MARTVPVRRSEPRSQATMGRHRGPGSRESLVDRAYEEIRRRILDNYYAPAHQVLELELAADLGMSRTPVREALVRLQNERFVQLIPRHGMRVVPLSVQDLREVYEVLTALELTAIERLARSELTPESPGPPYSVAPTSCPDPGGPSAIDVAGPDMPAAASPKQLLDPAIEPIRSVSSATPSAAHITPTIIATVTVAPTRAVRLDCELLIEAPE